MDVWLSNGHSPNVALNTLGFGAQQKTVNKILMTIVLWCRTPRRVKKHWAARLDKNGLLA
jgi:hypothetical protein